MSAQKPRKKEHLGKKLAAGGMLTVGATAGVLSQSANTASAAPGKGVINFLSGFVPESTAGKLGAGLALTGLTGWALKQAYKKVKNMYGNYKKKVENENNATFYDASTFETTTQVGRLNTKEYTLPLFSIFGGKNDSKNKMVVFSENNKKYEKGSNAIIKEIVDNNENNNEEKIEKVEVKDTEIGKAMQGVFEILKKEGVKYFGDQYDAIANINGENAEKLANNLNSKFKLDSGSVVSIKKEDLQYLKYYYKEMANKGANINHDTWKKNQKEIFIKFCEYVCYLKNQANKDLYNAKLANIEKYNVISSLMRKMVAGEYKGSTSFKAWLDTYTQKEDANGFVDLSFEDDLMKNRLEYYGQIYGNIFVLDNNILI